MNIRPKTEAEQIVDILMKLSEGDRNILLDYVQRNLMLPDDGYDYAAEEEQYDIFWPTQGCEA